MLKNLNLQTLKNFVSDQTNAFVEDESGVTAIEYGLIACLIAVVIISSVTLVGTKLDGIFNFIQGKLVTPSA